MSYTFADGLIRLPSAYHGAKSFSFARRISTLLMFSVSIAPSDSAGKQATEAPQPWIHGHDSSNRHPGLRARSEAVWHVNPPTQQMVAAERRHGGQLAHDQEVRGADRLLGECHSHKNPRRCLAGGTGMEEGARWAGIDQC